MVQDKSWTIADRSSEVWKSGVEQFVAESFPKVGVNGLMSCPCHKCKNSRQYDPNTIKNHILWSGMVQPYGMGPWYLHGEDLPARKVIVEDDKLEHGDNVVDDHYNDEIAKNASKQKASRVENPQPHHPALAQSLMKAACEKDEPMPDIFDIWLAGVKDKKGNVDDAARCIIEIFEAKCIEFTALNSTSEGCNEGSTIGTPTPRERAWDYLLNDYKKCANHGYILGMGSAITFPLLNRGKAKRSRSNSHMVAEKLKEMEEKLETTQEIVKQQLVKQQEIVKQQQETLKQQQETLRQQAAMLQEVMAMMTQQRQGVSSSDQSSDSYEETPPHY